MPNPDSSSTAPPIRPYQLGDQTSLGRSLGINPSNNGFSSAMAGLGQGLIAAGNSKGKSAGQAFASGAGGAITGRISIRRQALKPEFAGLPD